MRNFDHDIIITNIDLQRLLPVLDVHDTAASEMLETELHRATIVDQRAIPADVVTMNSEVTYEDCTTSARRTVRIVYPKDANVVHGRVSVLAPIGSALLGLRVGQTIDWALPSGAKRIRVLEIAYQPEASGDFNL